MEQIIFFFIAFLAVASAFFFVFGKNPIYSILSLIVTFFSIAALYILLNAQFLGIVQIIVYAGAIMVLFVFVVMMLNLGQHTVDQERKWLTSDAWAYPALMSFLVGLCLVWVLGSDYTQHGAVLGTQVIGPKAIGQALFTHYLLLVEVAAMLLLAALVAAFHLGKREPSAAEDKQ